MRSTVLIAVTGMVFLLAGCGSYSQVSQGVQGATSPAESGQHGAQADQIAAQPAQPEQERPLDQPYTNGMDDPSMEGSGNIAAQGNYKQVLQAQQKKSAAAAGAATAPVEKPKQR